MGDTTAFGATDATPQPEPARIRPSTSTLRVRRSALPTPLPEGQSAAPPEAVLAFIEGEDTSKRALGEAHIPQAGPPVVVATREEALADHLATLRGALAQASWDRIAPRLTATPAYARTIDHLLGERSLHLYAIAAIDQQGAEHGTLLSGSLRAFLGDQIAAANSLPGLLRAVCDPQDAEAFLVSAWPALVASPAGEGRREVYLRLRSTQPPASPTDRATVRRLAQEVIDRIDKLGQVLNRRRSHASPTPVATTTEAQVLRQVDLGLATLVDRDRKRGVAIELAARIESLLTSLPSEGFLSLNLVRLPDGVALCGCLLAANDPAATQLEERRFRYQPYRVGTGTARGPVYAAIEDLRKVVAGARGIQTETRRLSALTPSDPAAAARLNENDRRAQQIVDAASAILDGVLWPMAALVEEHPLPIQVHTRTGEGFAPIAFSQAFERLAGLTFAQATELTRAHVDYAAAICDAKSLKDFNDQHGLMRLGYTPGYERTFTFRTGAQLFLRALMADAARTTEVCEGRVVQLPTP